MPLQGAQRIKVSTPFIGGEEVTRHVKGVKYLYGPICFLACAVVSLRTRSLLINVRQSPSCSEMDRLAGWRL